MHSKKMTLVGLFVALAVLIVSSGCFSRTVIVNPLAVEDIFHMPQGSKVILPDGEEIITEKDGEFVSNDTIEDIFKARLGE